MAKVTGPLYSLSASGKIAGAMVFFPWKGLNVVRQWLKPSNPMTGLQGDRRLFLGGTGRACKVVQEDSYYIGESRLVAPGGQTWVSTLVDYVCTSIFTNATAYEAVVTAYNAHGSKAKFVSEAAALGLATFNIAYKATANSYAAGMQLYMLARYGVNQQTLDNTKFNQTPYTKALNTWNDADVDLLVDDITP